MSGDSRPDGWTDLFAPALLVVAVAVAVAVAMVMLAVWGGGGLQTPAGRRRRSGQLSTEPADIVRA
jgi:hypothetical protein